MHLSPAGSIEEKIFQRQLFKEGLSRCTIDEAKADRLFKSKSVSSSAVLT